MVKRFGNEEPRCPHCGGEMLDMGRDFHAPKQSKDWEWHKLEILTDGWKISGVFDSCGCCGPGARPRTFAEAKQQKREQERVPVGVGKAGRV